MLWPSYSISSMAGMPALVAGILTMRLGRSTRFQMSRTISWVPSVSCASDASTSIDTRPSTWSVSS